MQKMIEIIAAPTGEAPEWVRRAWVGLILPINIDQTIIDPIGVLGEDADKDNLQNSVLVNLTTAISILRKYNPQAAAWWEKNARYDKTTCLGFGSKFYRYK
ncbi:MAG: hypothetical protein ABIJ81_04330 [Patescibacteria group bacterium]